MSTWAPTRVERDASGLRVEAHGPGGTEELGADQILVAAGRRPNIEHLGLDAAGVAIDSRGVTVDWRHRTTNSRVYAAKDVCSPFHFTHAAYARPEYACLNALLPFRLNARDRVMSWTTFTDPEVAHAGMGWDGLRELQGRIDTYTQPLERNDRARVAITNGLRLRHIRMTIFAYPTWGEVVRKLADEWKFSTLTPATKGLVGAWLRWSRLWK